ncbi:hypothetical protein [Endozoicomonas ascidiicola]|nr:hypothetical protein [Endozoicomonas ascidiicola]
MNVIADNFNTLNYTLLEPRSDGRVAVSKKISDAISQSPAIALKIRSIIRLDNPEIDRYVNCAERTRNSEVREKLVQSICYLLTQNKFTPDIENKILTQIARPRLKKINMTPADLQDKQKFEISDCPDKSHRIDRESHSVKLRNTNLQWKSHPQIASNESRLHTINNVLNWVHQSFDPDQAIPLTLISIGAGNLLMEQMIHLNLVEMGVPEQYIRWCCIDTSYRKDLDKNNGMFESYKKSRKNFSENKDKDYARYFSTVNAYLSKSTDAGKLCAQARANTHILLLTLDPPTPLQGSVPEDCLTLTGRPTAPDKANTVFFVFSAAEDKEQLERIDQSIGASSPLVVTHGVRLCFDQGKINFTLSKGLEGTLFSQELKRLLTTAFEKTSQKVRDGSTTEQIQYLQSVYKTIVEKCAMKYGLAGTAIPLSEYQESVNQLKRFFFDSHELTLPSAHFNLENSKSTATSYSYSDLRQ